MTSHDTRNRSAVRAIDDHDHAGHEQVEEEPGAAQRFLAAIGEEVVAAINSRQGGEYQHRQQEEGAQAVQSDAESPVAGVPGETCNDSGGPPPSTRSVGISASRQTTTTPPAPQTVDETATASLALPGIRSIDRVRP